MAPPPLPSKSLDNLDPRRFLTGPKGGGSLRKCINLPGPLPQEVQRGKDRVAGPELQEKERGSDPNGLGSDPSSVLTLGGLCNSSGPQFPHLWNHDGKEAGRKLESLCSPVGSAVSDGFECSPQPVLGSVRLGRTAGWAPSSGSFQAWYARRRLV